MTTPRHIRDTETRLSETVDQVEDLACDVPCGAAFDAYTGQNSSVREFVERGSRCGERDPEDTLHGARGHDRCLGEHRKDACCRRPRSGLPSKALRLAVAGETTGPLELQLVDVLCQASHMLRRDDSGLDERREPVVHTSEGAGFDRAADVPVGAQPVDVAVAESRQHETDREHRLRGQTAPGKNGVDQSATDPTVAIGERMDRFELGVHDPGLYQRSVQGSVEIVDEVGHQRSDILGRWGDEICFERMPIRASDPILNLPEAVMPFVGQ